MVSGYVFPASLFSADQFVVSVPTDVSGSFNEMKILFVQGNGGGGAGGREDAERRSGHSPKIF